MEPIDKLVLSIHQELQREGLVTTSTREMTTMDDLTHNYTESADVTRSMLLAHGQVFIGGRRIQF